MFGVFSMISKIKKLLNKCIETNHRFHVEEIDKNTYTWLFFLTLTWVSYCFVVVVVVAIRPAMHCCIVGTSFTKPWAGAVRRAAVAPTWLSGSRKEHARPMRHKTPLTLYVEHVYLFIPFLAPPGIGCS